MVGIEVDGVGVEEWEGSRGVKRKVERAEPDLFGLVLSLFPPFVAHHLDHLPRNDFIEDHPPSPSSLPLRSPFLLLSPNRARTPVPKRRASTFTSFLPPPPLSLPLPNDALNKKDFSEG